MRVRRLGGDRAGEIRFTRFLRNPAVSLDEMVDTAFAQTQSACIGRDVLAIQDTTVVNPNDHGGGGDYLHAMMALDADDGAILGPLDATFWERTNGRKKDRKTLKFSDKQSHRWLASTERAAKLVGPSRVTMVADREADIFELFDRCPAHIDLIVRSHHNRALSDGVRMSEKILQTPRLGTFEVQLPSTAGRAARTATLSIKFGDVSVKPSKQLNKKAFKPISLNYVDLLEETPPDGLKPVHWRLITTYEVTTIEHALDVANRYSKRWKIEELFRTMKSKGFDIEALRIKDAEPRNRLILACLIAATIVLQMVAEREGIHMRPLTDAFDPSDQPLLEVLSADLEGKTQKQKNPYKKGSLAFATWVCARLGGWTGYYGKPGPIVILAGWTTFQSIRQGAYISQRLRQKNV